MSYKNDLKFQRLNLAMSHQQSQSSYNYKECNAREDTIGRTPFHSPPAYSPIIHICFWHLKWRRPHRGGHKISVLAAPTMMPPSAYSFKFSVPLPASSTSPILSPSLRCLPISPQNVNITIICIKVKCDKYYTNLVKAICKPALSRNGGLPNNWPFSSEVFSG